MLIKEFIAKVRGQLEALSEDGTDVSVPVRLASQKRIKELGELFSRKEYSEDEVTLETLRPFCELLERHWQYIKNTNGVYCVYPENGANQACMILANELAPHVHKHPLELLIPTLKEIVDLLPHQFVLSDNNEYPIDVSKCLDKAKENNTIVLYHTCTDRSGIPLSETERNRVINHSKDKYSLYYYDAICYRFNRKMDITAHLERSRQELFNAIKTREYKIKELYGEEGNQCSMANLLRDDKNRFIMRHELISMMTNRLSKDEWQRCVDYISLDDLNQIIINNSFNNGGYLENLLKKNTLKYDEEIYNRALIFCLLELYERQRNGEPEYKTLHGRYIGFYAPWFTGCYPKSHELDVARMLKVFVISDRALSELSTCLQKEGLEDRDGQLQMGATLSLFVQQIKQMACITKEVEHIPTQSPQRTLRQEW